MSFISKFGQSFMNVTKATARHVAFGAEVAAASKMDFAKGSIKDMLSNVALGFSAKTILTADQQGIVDNEYVSTALGGGRGAFYLSSLKNKATEMDKLFSDTKVNFQQNDFEKLAINAFSLSKMIFGEILPGVKMGLSLLASGYSAGINSAYPAYEQKMIGHLDIVDSDEEEMIVISSADSIVCDISSSSIDQEFGHSELIGVSE